MVLKELIFKLIFWEGVVVFKELIFNSFCIGRLWWSRNNLFLTVDTLG